MVKTKSKGLLIVVSGISGSGKSTINKQICDRNQNVLLSVSCTTREKREGEIDGKDYYFITREEFEKKIENNEFLEYAVVHQTNYYGTPKSNIEELLKNGKDVILEIDIQGAMKIKENYKEALCIFILPPSMDEIRRRLITRGTTDKDELLRRFKSAYKELNGLTKYNYVVINDILENAVKKVESIIIAERCRVDRIEEFYLNNEEEFIHECLIEDKEFINEDTKL